MFELLSIPAIIAAVEAFKKAGLSSKFAALTAIALGVLFGVLSTDILNGLLMGLASSGLYSGAKSMLK